VAINFWAGWCGPCRDEASAFEHLARSLHGQARLVGVNWNDSLDSARSFISAHHLTFPNLRDADGTVGDSYRITGLPTTFIVDSRGRITDVLQGPQDVSDVERALRAAH
jgi:peroxiredoxin